MSFQILFYVLSKRSGCLSRCLVFSECVQKLFCGSYSTFKWCFAESVGEKVVSPFYSSTTLGLPQFCCLVSTPSLGPGPSVNCTSILPFQSPRTDTDKGHGCYPSSKKLDLNLVLFLTFEHGIRRLRDSIVCIISETLHIKHLFPVLSSFTHFISRLILFYFY